MDRASSYRGFERVSKISVISSVNLGSMKVMGTGLRILP